jgi:hypothetical protein
MSRRVYLLGLGLALVALALAFTDWALSLRPGVTEANVRRIENGMTMDQVEAILGGAGSLGERPHPPTDVVLTGEVIRGGRCRWFYHWTGADGYALVIFAYPWDSPNERGRVERACFVRTASPPLFQRLRAWLGW